MELILNNVLIDKATSYYRMICKRKAAAAGGGGVDDGRRVDGGTISAPPMQFN